MRVFGVLALTVLLPGCATQMRTVEASEPVPAGRVYLVSGTPGAGAGQIVVKRDAGWMGSACADEVYLNGQKAANVRAGEQVGFHLAAGEYVVTVTATMCAGGTSEMAVNLAPGQRKIVRIAHQQSGDLLVQPSAF